MIMYYSEIKSLNDVLGEDRFLRVPEYITEIFVKDRSREDAIEKSIEILTKGGSVIILGKAGSGKTSTLAIILKEIIARGFRLGLLNYSVNSIDNSHMEKGIIVFYDDLSLLPPATIKTLFDFGIKGFIATLREEEKDRIEKIVGRKLEDSFFIVRVEEMSDEAIVEVLRRLTLKEGITIESPQVYLIVAKKAKRLPVYVWQLIRDLKINKLNILTREFAEKVPEGMLDYVDNILWRVLDEHEERREILLTLIILSDMPNYEMHQELFNIVYVMAKEELYGRKFDLKSALFSDLLDRISRYLAKSSKYSVRLPHDSWKDVLEGKSKGLMSGDISRLRTIFRRDKRREILAKAASITLELVQKEGDIESIYELIEQLKRADIKAERREEKAEVIEVRKEEIAERPEAVEVKKRFYLKAHKLYAYARKDRRLGKILPSPEYKELYKEKKHWVINKLTDVSLAIANTLSTLSGKNYSSLQILKMSEAEKIRSHEIRVIYPEIEGLNVMETITKIELLGSASWILWIFFVPLMIFLSGIFFFVGFGLNWAIGAFLAYLIVSRLPDELTGYLIEIDIYGSEDKIKEFIEFLKASLVRDPLAGLNFIVEAYLDWKYGLNKTRMRKSWEMIGGGIKVIV